MSEEHESMTLSNGRFWSCRSGHHAGCSEWKWGIPLRVLHVRVPMQGTYVVTNLGNWEIVIE
jgi:hypothetical protein